MMRISKKLLACSFALISACHAIPFTEPKEVKVLNSGDEIRGQKSYGSVEVDEIVRVYDGDTITVNISDYPDVVGKEISVRIYGIDTPEIRTKNEEEKALGYKARDFVKKLLMKAEKVELRDLRRDKYFRLLADVYADGKSVGEELIEAKLARPYFGGKKEPWCVSSEEATRTISTEYLIEEITQQVSEQLELS